MRGDVGYGVVDLLNKARHGFRQSSRPLDAALSSDSVHRVGLFSAVLGK